MDIRTLAMILGVTSIIQVIAFSLQASINKTYRGIGWWLLWSASAAAGFVFIILRAIPAILKISIIAQNSLLVLGVIFLNIGIMRFLDKKEKRGMLAAIFIAFFSAMLYFTYANDDIAVRTVAIGAALASVSLLTARDLYTHKLPSVKASANFIAAFFLAHGVYFFLRTLLVVTGTDVQDMFRPSFFNMSAYLDAIIVSIIWTCGLIIMVNQRSNAEMAEATSHFESIFNTSPDGAVITRLADGLIVEINHGFTTLTAWSREEVIGKSSIDIPIWKNPADRQKIVAILRAKGFSDNFEAEFQRKDGSLLFGLMSAKIINLRGSPHIISITRDISERRGSEQLLHQNLDRATRSRQALLSTLEDHKLAIEALRLSEKKLRETQEMARLGHWSWDIKTGAVEWSEEVYRIFHLDPNSFTPQIDSILALSPWPEDHERDQELIRRAMAAREKGTYEQRFLLPDKSIGYYHSTFQGSYDDTGNLTTIVGTVLDITERKRSEEALRETEAKFRQTFEFSPVGIVMVGLDKRFLRCNSAFAESIGFTPEELVGKTITDITYPDDIHIGMDEMKAIARGELAISNVQKRYLHKDGRSIWGEATISLIRDHKADPQYFMAIIQDISMRKQAEEMLEKSVKQYRLLFDEMFSGFALHEIICDQSGTPTDYRFLSANTAFEKITGLDARDILGKTVLEVMPGTESSWIERYGKVALTGEPAQFENYAAALGKHYEVRAYCPEHGKFATLINDISERKRAEKTLVESEKKFRSLFESMSEGIVYEDHAGNIISANPAAERLLGLSLNQLQGRTSLDPRWKAIHEDGSPFPGESHSLHVAAKTGKPAKDEVMGIYNPQAGTYVWLSVNSTPEFLPGEKEPYRAFAVFRDITERKKAEETIRRSEERLRAILDATPFPIAIVDVQDSKIDFWSSSALALFGHTAPTTAEWYELAYPDPDYRNEVIARWKPFLEKARSSGQGVNTGEYQITCRDGSVLICELQAAFLAEDLIVTFNNVTERKRAEAALQESERKFRETVITLDEGYYSVTLDGKLLEHNQAFNRILGFDIHEDLKGIQLPDFWQDPDQRKEYLMAFAASGSISNYQIEAKTHKGDKITIMASAHLVKKENERPQRIEGVFLDISGRMRDEVEIRRLNEELEKRVLQRTAQLEAANKELEAFSYSVSHDLRAPLRAIDGFSRIVLEDYSPKLDTEGLRLLNVIAANTQKMGHLIDDLLAFSRLSRQQLAFSGVDMAGLAEGVFSELIALEINRKIEFKVGAPPAAFGDRSLLRQVLQNLLANAIKFSRAKKPARIEFDGGIEGAENVYFVKDNGVGFDMKYVDKLFGVFQRLHGSSEFEGTGVGLAIVQRIVLHHGGRVWAESKGGKGATFYFSLPTDQGLGSRVEGIEKKELRE